MTLTPSTSQPQPLDLAQMTAATVDLERTYTLEELMAMPSVALEELWRAVPDQALYEEAFEQVAADEFKNNPLVGEAERLSFLQSLIDVYLGLYPSFPSHRDKQDPRKVMWAIRPHHVLAPAQASEAASGQAEAGEEPIPLSNLQPEPHPLSPRILVIAGLAVLIGLCIVVGVLRKQASRPPTTAEMTATAAAATQMALVPPTPTPLALEDIDRPISAGEDLRSRYPVTLEIRPAASPARIFPVQQKEVQIAEWDYEANPDVASSVLGLVVRPVLGIPFTSSNAAFLAELLPGDAILLHMNTGQALEFAVSGQERVPREAVAIFDQTEPGIVLVLVADSAPTRLVIYGQYLPGQELASQAGSSDTPAASGQPVTHGDTGVTITALSTRTSGGPAGAPLPPEWLYLLVDISIATDHDLDTRSITFSLVDAAGTHYSPTAVEGLAATPFNGQTLAAGQELVATLGFLAPRSLSAPRLVVQVAADSTPVEYSLAFDPAGPPDARSLQVALSGVETLGEADSPGGLVVRARLYNPTAQPIVVLPGDVTVIYSPTVLEDAFPVGPALFADTFVSLTVQPGQALDVELRFPWQGEPYVGITLGGYQYVAILR